MAFYDKFPYTNFQELNLDKILSALKTLQEEMKDFISNNVIKYADPIQWDITKQYEANTVVADSDGNAYLSSKPVPVGVALSNTNYWSQIGNFDALFNVIKDAISPYNVPMLGSTATSAQPVNDLLWVGDDLYKTTTAISAGDTIAAGTNVTESNINVRIRELMNALTSVRTDFTAADDDIRLDFHAADSSIRNTINANQSANNARFQAIENQLTALQDKYYVFIGDSFAEGWTPDGNTTPFWSLLKTHLQIANDHFFTSYIGGAGFTTGTTFLTLLQNLNNTITDKTKITDIYVMGGRNDFGHAINDIKAARDSFINYSKVNYPNAVIHVGFIGKSFERTDATNMTIQYNTFLGYKQDCEQAGAVYMDGIETSVADSALYASDRKHPNQSGQNSIYNALLSLVISGSFTFISQIYPTLVYETGVSGPSGDISVNAYGNVTTIVITARTFVCPGNNVTLNKYLFRVGTFDRMLGDLRAYQTFNGVANAVIKLSNAFYTVPVVISILNNQLTLTLTGTVDAHNNYLSGNLQEIQLSGFRLQYNNVRGD